MRKLSSRQFTKISKRHFDEKAIIQKMRETAKNDSTVIGKFKEYGIPISEIEKVSISFDDLDVSAKTKDRKIYLNRALLEKVDFDALVSYLAHELVHFLQQTTGNTSGSSAKDYLEKDTEIESFKTQIDYKKDHEGKQESKKYVDELLDYHKYKGKDRKDKKEELLGEE